MSIIAIPVVETVVTVKGVTITLDASDARVLRTMLGGLRRNVRRAAVRCNGGSKASADRARFLVKELNKLFDDAGLGRLTEVPVTDDAPGVADDSHED